MRAKVKKPSPELVLTRILESLEQELVDATDEEILEAAKQLGMDPTMKGSALYLGLKYAAKWRFADFFGVEGWGNTRIEVRRNTDPTPKKLKRDGERSTDVTTPRDRKDK